MMQLEINGEQTQLPAGSTLSDLLRHLALEGRRLAIELNLEVIPRSQYDAQTLRAGDRVEVVHAIGGG